MIADEKAALKGQASPPQDLQGHLGRFLANHATLLNSQKRFNTMHPGDPFWIAANLHPRVRNAYQYARKSLPFIQNSVLGVLDFMRQALNHATDLDAALGNPIDMVEVEDYLHVMFPLYLPTLVEILIINNFHQGRRFGASSTLTSRLW
ncbi:hypothetical protein LIER_20643 [Lithospermum erythrorhizon]|uniref:Uncharacterized protein n=1 Tax=Lithospermum erythrorhizon TaxID=34254 RepID=A0AAV3QN58_LITER